MESSRGRVVSWPSPFACSSTPARSGSCAVSGPGSRPKAYALSSRTPSGATIHICRTPFSGLGPAVGCVRPGRAPRRRPVPAVLPRHAGLSRGRAALAPSIRCRRRFASGEGGRGGRRDGCRAPPDYVPGRGCPTCRLRPGRRGRSWPQCVKAIADTLPLTLEVDRAALIDSATGETWPLDHVPWIDVVVDQLARNGTRTGVGGAVGPIRRATRSRLAAERAGWPARARRAATNHEITESRSTAT